MNEKILSDSNEYIEILKETIEQQRLEIIALKMVNNKLQEFIKGTIGLDDK